MHCTVNHPGWPDRCCLSIPHHIYLSSGHNDLSRHCKSKGVDVYFVTAGPHLKVRLLRCLLSPGCWCLCLGAGLGDWYLK